MDNWQERLQLTSWDNRFEKTHFDLLTIHSLLVDAHPKFQQLKQIIANFNREDSPHRIRYQQPFVAQLFKMLSELTRLETTE